MSEALRELIVTAVLSAVVVAVLLIIAKFMGAYADPIKSSIKNIVKNRETDAVIASKLDKSDYDKPEIAKLFKSNYKRLKKIDRYIFAYEYDNKCITEAGVVNDAIKKIKRQYALAEITAEENNLELMKTVFINIGLCYEDLTKLIYDMDDEVKAKSRRTFK